MTSMRRTRASTSGSRATSTPRRVTDSPSSSAPATLHTSSVRSASAAPNSFHNQWLDLQPLIDKNHYDMTQYPKSTVELYNVGGEGQVGIPYAIYPSVLWYKSGLFKEAGLNEPPHTFNSKYTMPDGSVVPWDYDTIRKLALLLTVDKNGKDATEAGFDPTNVVQWGFEPQRDDLRQTGAYWKAGSFVGPDGKTVVIPDAWKAAWTASTTPSGPITRPSTMPSSRTPTSTPVGIPSSPARSR